MIVELKFYKDVSKSVSHIDHQKTRDNFIKANNSKLYWKLFVTHFNNKYDYRLSQNNDFSTK